MSGTTISDMLARSPMKERLAGIEGEATDVVDGKPTVTGESSESAVIVETTVTIKQNPKYKGIVDEGKLDQWLQFARKTFDRRCVLFTDPGSFDGVRDLLKSTAAGKLSGTGGGQGPFVGVVYSCSRAGEASSRAHLRIVNYREQHCQRMIKGAMQAGAAANGIPEHDFSPGHLFVLCDGKCRANTDKMKKTCMDSDGKVIPKHVRQIYSLTTKTPRSLECSDNISFSAKISDILIFIRNSNINISSDLILENNQNICIMFANIMQI